MKSESPTTTFLQTLDGQYTRARAEADRLDDSLPLLEFWVKTHRCWHQLFRGQQGASTAEDHEIGRAREFLRSYWIYTNRHYGVEVRHRADAGGEGEPRDRWIPLLNSLAKHGQWNLLQNDDGEELRAPAARRSRWLPLLVQLASEQNQASGNLDSPPARRLLALLEMYAAMDPRGVAQRSGEFLAQQLSQFELAASCQDSTLCSPGALPGDSSAGEGLVCFLAHLVTLAHQSTQAVETTDLLPPSPSNVSPRERLSLLLSYWAGGKSWWTQLLSLLAPKTLTVNAAKRLTLQHRSATADGYDVNFRVVGPCAGEWLCALDHHTEKKGQLLAPEQEGGEALGQRWLNGDSIEADAHCARWERPCAEKLYRATYRRESSETRAASHAALATVVVLEGGSLAGASGEFSDGAAARHTGQTGRPTMVPRRPTPLGALVYDAPDPRMEPLSAVEPLGEASAVPSVDSLLTPAPLRNDQAQLEYALSCGLSEESPAPYPAVLVLWEAGERALRVEPSSLHSPALLSKIRECEERLRQQPQRVEPLRAQGLERVPVFFTNRSWRQAHDPRWACGMSRLRNWLETHAAQLTRDSRLEHLQRAVQRVRSQLLLEGPGRVPRGGRLAELESGFAALQEQFAAGQAPALGELSGDAFEHLLTIARQRKLHVLDIEALGVAHEKWVRSHDAACAMRRAQLTQLVHQLLLELGIDPNQLVAAIRGPNAANAAEAADAAWKNLRALAQSEADADATELWPAATHSDEARDDHRDTCLQRELDLPLRVVNALATRKGSLLDWLCEPLPEGPLDSTDKLALLLYLRGSYRPGSSGRSIAPEDDVRHRLDLRRAERDAARRQVAAELWMEALKADRMLLSILRDVVELSTCAHWPQRSGPTWAARQLRALRRILETGGWSKVAALQSPAELRAAVSSLTLCFRHWRSILGRPWPLQQRCFAYKDLPGHYEQYGPSLSLPSLSRADMLSEQYRLHVALCLTELMLRLPEEAFTEPFTPPEETARALSEARRRLGHPDLVGYADRKARLGVRELIARWTHQGLLDAPPLSRDDSPRTRLDDMERRAKLLLQTQPAACTGPAISQDDLDTRPRTQPVRIGTAGAKNTDHADASHALAPPRPRAQRVFRSGSETPRSAATQADSTRAITRDRKLASGTGRPRSTDGTTAKRPQAGRHAAEARGRAVDIHTAATVVGLPIARDVLESRA